MEKLEITVNLQRLAMQAAAQGIWSSNPVVVKIQNIFPKMNQLGGYDEWEDLIKEVIKNTQQLSLPVTLNAELLNVVKVTGLRIYDWYFYLRNIHLFESFTGDTYKTYLEKIYWTKIGTIDEVKTLKLFWLKNPNTDIFKIFLLACNFCCLDVIDQLWEKLPQDVRSANYLSMLWKSKFWIAIYWIYYKRSAVNDFIQHMNQIGFYDANKTLEENLMNRAVINGQHLTVKYFWNKFNDEIKENNVLNWFENSFAERIYSPRHRQYNQDRYIEIYILLFNNLTEDMKRAIYVLKPNVADIYEGDLHFHEFNNLVGVLAWAYPWQELFIPAFSHILKFLEIYAISHTYQDVMEALKWNSYFGIGVKNSFMQGQLSISWRLLAPELKYSVARYILRSLFSFLDLKNMRLILNDEVLSKDRDKLFRIGFKKLILYCKKEEIAQVVKELLIFNTWNDDVIEIAEKIYDIVMNNFDVDEAEEYLNAQCNSNEGKKEILKKLNHKFLAYYLVKENAVETLVKYSKWVFPLEKDLNNFKKSLTKMQFTRDLICEIWFSPSEATENWSRDLCDRFLNWIFLFEEGELFKKEVVSYKRNRILNYLKIEDARKFQSYLYSGNFEVSFKFLSWCGCSSDEVDQFKRYPYVGYFLSGECERLIQENDLQGLEKLLNWYFCSFEEKNNFMEEFITSKNGISSLNIFIGAVESKETDPDLKMLDIVQKFKTVISFWIKSLDTFIKVEEHFTKICHDKFQGSNDENEMNNLMLDFEEDEKAIFPWDIEWRESNDFVIWDEENFKLFLSLVVEARTELEKKIGNDHVMVTL